MSVRLGAHRPRQGVSARPVSLLEEDGSEARFPAAPAFWPRFLLVKKVTKVVHSGRSVVVAGCAHVTTHMNLVLADSVDHTLKRLPLLLAAVVVDDTQFPAVGKSHQVSQQLQRAGRLFPKHADEVAFLVVSKKLEVITNDERVRTYVCNNEVHADALRTCTRNLGGD